MAARIVTMASKDEVAISPITRADATVVAITNGDNTSDPQELATVWATPIEARLLAAAIVDVADTVDNIDDGSPAPNPESDLHREWRIECDLRQHAQTLLSETTTQLVDAELKLEWVRGQHTHGTDVHVDTIHRGLTDVYDVGCVECGVRWPCDTIRILDGDWGS